MDKFEMAKGVERGMKRKQLKDQVGCLVIFGIFFSFIIVAAIFNSIGAGFVVALILVIWYLSWYYTEQR